jgi:hypothetical protein
VDKNTRLLRNKETAADAVTLGIRNRTPRNGEYAGPHSETRVKESLELAEKYRQKLPCGPNHFVYPSGLIARRGKVKY